MASISRITRGVVAVVATVTLAAACGSGSSKDSGSDTASGQLTGRGPITLAQGKDTSGNVQNQVNAWNKAHPKETVRLVELPESADQQRQQMVQNAQTKSDAYTVLNLDVVWTAEFAANRWVTPLPKDQFALNKFLPSAVQTGEYRGNMYAAPWKTDAGLLYYRKDLLKNAGISTPPKTWAELQVRLRQDQGRRLLRRTVRQVRGTDLQLLRGRRQRRRRGRRRPGQAERQHPAGQAGPELPRAGFKSGMIPREAITYEEEDARRAFEKGNLVFLRQWPYQWALSSKAPKVKGKFDVAPLPGLNGPGASTLGGHNLAISSFAKNKATALDFIKYLTSEDTERLNLIASSEAPTSPRCTTSRTLQKKFPYLPTLKASLLNAKPRPKAVRYNDVTTAIQESVYSALTGKTSTDQALADLQSKLGPLTQQ